MSDFELKIFNAARQAVQEVWSIEPDESQLMVEAPRDPKLGDYATSVAMRLAKVLHKSPIEIAQPLAERLAELLPEAESVTVAKPGFINFRLKGSALSALINQVIEAGDDYGKTGTLSGSSHFDPGRESIR